MSTIIGHTARVACFTGDKVELVTIEYSSAVNDVRLRAMNGHTMTSIGAELLIPLAEFVARPCDPYDQLAEAKWALAKLGLAPVLVIMPAT